MRHPQNPARVAQRLLVGTVIVAGAIGAASGPASAATTASFGAGVLTVVGDGANNSIVVSRNAAGRILVNNGAVAVAGGTPTVANTTLIRVFGLAGNDRISLNETNGALPPANLAGGAGHDTLIGGSGADRILGQGGSDTLSGVGGVDRLFGGSGNDTMTGGDGDDQAFGQGDNDRMVWNPGDDTDLNEGGVGSDTVEVNGGNGAEQFTTTANGARVRFDRTNPTPFAIDIGTSETLLVKTNGGDDSYATTGNLAGLVAISVDGGAGNDRILGSNGADRLLGGDGTDFVDGEQGNDLALLGAGEDTFQWDPGDGSDTVEGQAGTDVMLFNGSNAAENMEVTANGPRVRFLRDLGTIVMDLDDVERIDVNTLGETDKVVVNNLTATDVTDVRPNLTGIGGGDDGAPDNVIVNATNGDDAVTVTGQGPNTQVLGLRPRVSVTGAIAGSDRVTVKALAGDDVVDASTLFANSALLTLDGGDDDDVLIGGNGDDNLLGGAGDDVLIGGPGNDTIDGGPGDNIVLESFGADAVISARPAGNEWLTRHARTVNDTTVLDVGGKHIKLPRLDLAELARDATTP